MTKNIKWHHMTIYLNHMTIVIIGQLVLTTTAVFFFLLPDLCLILCRLSWIPERIVKSNSKMVKICKFSVLLHSYMLYSVLKYSNVEREKIYIKCTKSTRNLDIPSCLPFWWWILKEVYKIESQFEINALTISIFIHQPE